MTVFALNFVGLLLILSFVVRAQHRNLCTQAHLQLLRGTTRLGAMYWFFYAIAHMRLADAMPLKLIARLVAVNAG